MMPRSLLVTCRGAFAIRVIGAAAELGIRTMAIFAEGHRRSLHRREAGEASALGGAAAYRNSGQISAIARNAG